MNKRPKSREETPKEGSGSAGLPHRKKIHRDAQIARDDLTLLRRYFEALVDKKKKGRLRWQAAQV